VRALPYERRAKCHARVVDYRGSSVCPAFFQHRLRSRVCHQRRLRWIVTARASLGAVPSCRIDPSQRSHCKSVQERKHFI
jgi:hypothetical protein